MERPNILFVQVDQLTASVLRAYGGTICRTPNIDRLAREGVVFERAYCNSPLCAPSRFSMATGQLCSRIGAYDNAAEMPASIPTYAHHLRRQGYVTALSGKMHFVGPDQYHGFEHRLTADLYPADFIWVPNWGDEGVRDTNDSRTVSVSGVCEHSVQIRFDDEATRRATEFLYDHARFRRADPFFLQVSYTHPHDPYLCQRKYWELYDDDEIPPPRVGPLPTAQHDAHSIRLMKDFGMYGVEFTADEIARARRAYLGAVSYIDDQLGRVLDVLRSTGKSDNTAIIFTSDHGEMLGERGMWMKKHLFDPAVRVPLVLSAPWIQPQRVSELVSLVDLLPTFNGLAAGSTWNCEVESLEGTDLTAMLGRESNTSGRTVYAEYLAETTRSPILMVRKGRFKYIYSSRDPKLLYDLDNDPDELENLAYQPEFAAIVDQFDAEVDVKWDYKRLTDEILLSQQRRRLINQAHARGGRPRWNHGESPGEEVVWYRGGEGSYSDWAFDYLEEVGKLGG